MVSVTSAARSVCIPTTLSRSNVVRAQLAPVRARPAARLIAFRLPSTSRSLALKVTINGSCREPMPEACGPSDNQRWRGSGQRSFALWAHQANNSLWVPVDVEETAQHYTFVADVPGLGKNDVKVQVNKDREMSISGERLRHSSTASSSSSISDDGKAQAQGSSKKSARETQRLRAERRFGTFRKSWNLPEDANVSQIKASVDQGVLTVVINRTPSVRPKVTEIPIN